jgi:thioesterase domain-containing protein
MYTSGSTGLPKGVEVHHGNIVRLVCGASYVRLDASRTFLLLAPIAFDASTFELWGALLHGARCVIYPARLPTPLSLGETLQRHRVDTLWLTASLFNLVVDEKPEILRGVSQLLTGGEALSPPHVQRALALLPNTQLINGYGPTESTTFACCYPIPHDLTEECGSVPIGRPISNTLCHVLDAHGNLTPIGVPGELYIGGAGLARGYLNRPELTAERFVPSPFRPGERLYRTGDQVRWREDGVLEFLGRIDHQIKLRGYRIEPGEIEAVLQQDEAIQQSLVLPREDRPGDMRLVAYLVGQGIEVDTVRARLKAHLPDYMIPAAFVVLDHLPLTPNGKVDRQALPPPDDSRPQLESGYVAPRSHIEATLAEIWANTLNLPRVGIFDNYFALGGHSLLAVRLMERIQQSIGRTLHLNTLWYQAGNIAQQAHLLTDQSESSASSKSVLLLRQGGNVPALFCLHTIGGGNLFHYEPLIRYLNSDRPVYGLQAKGIDRNEKPDTTIEAMAEYCIQSMRAIQPNGPYLLCGFSSGGLLAFEMARLLENEGIETKLFMVDTFLPNQPRSFWRRLNGWLNLVKPDHFRDLQERIYHSFLSSLGLSHLRSLRGLGESHRWAMWSYHPQASGLSADYFEASERANNQPRPSAGWASFLNGGITIHMIPGTHGTMVKHNNALVLAKKISACLS